MNPVIKPPPLTIAQALPRPDRPYPTRPLKECLRKGSPGSSSMPYRRTTPQGIHRTRNCSSDVARELPAGSTRPAAEEGSRPAGEDSPGLGGGSSRPAAAAAGTPAAAEGTPVAVAETRRG